MTTTQPAGQSRKRTSLRTDILEDRPVNLDGFVEEWPEKGLVAMESAFDPEPG
ncbi:MAG TPA: propanediol/glycerol family dehydratase large subunit, partial [Pseudonocardia sp.]|nr:propanediol/glycerol family dehydratase large subunit [Pseudonocardia sp.]